MKHGAKHPSAGWLPVLLLGLCLPAASAWAEASLYFITPAHGEVVSSPVTVRFGLKGMGVAPAGVERDGTGHHHLIVDAPQPDLSMPVAKDAHHLHFGGGQTETRLNLSPGRHTLQLLLGDARHRPHKPAVISEKIVIFVRDE